MTDIRAELESLRASLVPVPVPANAVPARAEPAPELEAMLKDLRDTIADASEDAEKAIAAHPGLAVGGAFLLGLIVGRVTGRL